MDKDNKGQRKLEDSGGGLRPEIGLHHDCGGRKVISRG